MVTEIRRAERYRNSNNAAIIFMAIPTLLLEEIFAFMPAM